MEVSTFLPTFKSNSSVAFLTTKSDGFYLSGRIIMHPDYGRAGFCLKAILGDTMVLITLGGLFERPHGLCIL